MAAQTVNLSLAAGRAGLWWAALIVATLVLGVFILIARKVCLRSEKSGRIEDLSLEQMRSLRDSGQISDDEFAVIRRKALNLAPRAGEKGKTKSSNPGELDDGTKSAPEG